MSFKIMEAQRSRGEREALTELLTKGGKLWVVARQSRLTRRKTVALTHP